VREWEEVEFAVGRQLRDVVVGWHHIHGEREPVLLWLLLDDQWVEVHTAGDGSLRLVLADGPVDVDMAESGRFEMVSAGPTHLLRPLIGSVISRTRRVTWQRKCVGVVLASQAGAVLLANDCDEIFVSTGELPPDYTDAVIDD
jgi:hypothetical protein